MKILLKKLVPCFAAVAILSSSFFSFTSSTFANETSEQSVEQRNATDGTLVPMLPNLENNQEYSAAAIKVGNVFVELALWFTQEAIDGIKRSYNTVFVDEVYQYASQIDQKTQYKYYIVKMDPNKNGRLYSSTVLTLDEAVKHITDVYNDPKKPPKVNIWTPNQVSALQLAKKLAPLSKPEGPENEAQINPYNKPSTTRYYWHYHDGKRKADHIFYGTNYVVGRADPYFVEPNYPTDLPEEAFDSENGSESMSQ